MADALRVGVTASRLYHNTDIIGLAFAGLLADSPGRRIVLVHGRCDPRGWAGKHWPIPWDDAERMSSEEQLCLWGGDWLADRLGRRLGWGIEAYPADWEAPCRDTCPPGHRRKRSRLATVDYCPLAGHYRNDRMVASRLDLWLAFFASGEENRGTLDCASKAVRAGAATLCYCDICPAPGLFPCQQHSLPALIRAWGAATRSPRRKAGGQGELKFGQPAETEVKPG